MTVIGASRRHRAEDAPSSMVVKRQVPPEKFSIERPPTLAATVAERVRQAIIDLELPLGSEVSEAGIAQKFGVSRTPVREALYLLQLQGMVTIVPQKGSYVFFPNEQDLIDICDYRISVEQHAIKLCKSRQEGLTVSDLDRSLELMQSALHSGDSIGYGRADTMFHEAFIKNCGNRFLQEGYALISGPIATLRTHLTAFSSDEQRHSFAEHQNLSRYFSDNKLKDMEELLARHILRTRDSYVRALKEGFINPIPGKGR